MMVIADSEKPLVVAGIMGSVDAEVDTQPQTLFLNQHGSIQEAFVRPPVLLGYIQIVRERFSRDVDPQGVEFAAQRAVDLILEIAGGTASEEYVSIGNATQRITDHRDRTNLCGGEVRI